MKSSRYQKIALAVIALCLLSSIPAFAGSSTHVRSYTRKDGTYVSSHYRSSTSVKSSLNSKSTTHYSSHVSATRFKPRYSKASTTQPERSESEKKAFLRTRGLKRVPSGYQVDHIVPLSEGGADKPSNMELLPTSLHKAKTAREASLYHWGGNHRAGSSIAAKHIYSPKLYSKPKYH